MADTSMTLTGTKAALAINVAGTGGTLAVATAISGKTGYDIAARETNEGVPYTELTVVAANDAADPPTLAVTVAYEQAVKIAELDLEARYTDIPDGTELQVASTNTKLNISKRPISGSSLIGSSARNQAAFEATIDLMLWIGKPAEIVATSAVTLNLSKIGDSDGGPVKKTLLQKIVLKLAS